MKKPPIRVTIPSSIALCAALAGAGYWVRLRADTPDVNPVSSIAAQTVASVSPNPQTISPAESNRHPAISPLPAQYEVLRKRSLFSKSRIANSGKSIEAGKEEMELQFVLRGVANHDGKFVAFVETTGNNELVKLHAGDQVARGRLSDISFRGVDYNSATGVTKVAIGCALNGVPIRPPTTSPSGGVATLDSSDGKTGKNRKQPVEGPAAESTGSPAAAPVAATHENSLQSAQ